MTQNLSQYALLTKANDLTGVVSVGGGVKMKLGAHAWLRLDVHDYMSPFPKQVITPNVRRQRRRLAARHRADGGRQLRKLISVRPSSIPQGILFPASWCRVTSK